EIQLENLEKQLGLKERELQEVQDSIKNILQHVDLSDEDLIGLYEEKTAIEKGLQELERDYYSFRGVIKKLEEEIHVLRKNIEVSDSLLNELKDQRNNYHLELNAFRERLAVEFSFDIDELHDLEKTEEDEYSLLEKIKRIKKQLDDFGAINPIAMEAFQEMNERFQFIQ